jgi:hypothetical protein
MKRHPQQSSFIRKSCVKSALLAAVLITTAGISKTAHAQEVFEFLVQSFARNNEVINAVKEFDAAYNNVLTENGLVEAGGAADVSARRTKLKDDYYTEQFGAEYKNKNAGKEAPIAESISALSDISVVLQTYYIEENSNPLGSKHKLDKGGDKSTYSQIHEKYHPKLREFLEAQGLYDIFLYRLDGQNLYTCFKELDFTRFVYDPTLQPSSLAEVVKASAESNDKNFTKLTDMKPYIYSYELPAKFVSAPIYEGDKKIGVLVFQLPPGI